MSIFNWFRRDMKNECFDMEKKAIKDEFTDHTIDYSADIASESVDTSIEDTESDDIDKTGRFNTPNKVDKEDFSGKEELFNHISDDSGQTNFEPDDSNSEDIESDNNDESIISEPDLIENGEALSIDNKCENSDTDIPKGSENKHAITLDNIIHEGSLTKKIACLFTGEVINIPYGFTSIDDAAFRSRTDIIEMTLPDSIYSIYENAFSSCINLRKVNIPKSVKWIHDRVFLGCKSLENIIIPANVSSIGSYSFSNCINLEWLIIENGVSSIDDHAFNSCKKIKSIEIPDSVKHISSSAFKNCSALESVSLSNKIDYIPSEIFSGCVNLLSVEIPEGVKEIGRDAFLNCKRLKNLVIPNTVKKLEFNVLFGCRRIETIALSKNMKVIPEYLFSNQERLSTLTIPNGVEIIREYAFSHCSKLESITLPESLRQIDAYSFEMCKNLKKVVIPDSVEKIAKFAFQYCSELQAVTLSKKITVIPESLCAVCSSLISITIPKGVTRIGDEAFYSCMKLKKITIPEGVTSIGDKAFYCCSCLEEVYLPSSVTTIGKDAFALTRSGDKITFITEKGSYASGYCKRNNFNYKIAGLVSEENDELASTSKVEISPVSLIQKNAEPSEEQKSKDKKTSGVSKKVTSKKETTTESLARKDRIDFTIGFINKNSGDFYEYFAPENRIDNLYGFVIRGNVDYTKLMYQFTLYLCPTPSTVQSTTFNEPFVGLNYLIGGLSEHAFDIGENILGDRDIAINRTFFDIHRYGEAAIDYLESDSVGWSSSYLKGKMDVVAVRQHVYFIPEDEVEQYVRTDLQISIPRLNKMCGLSGNIWVSEYYLEETACYYSQNDFDRLSAFVKKVMSGVSVSQKEWKENTDEYTCGLLYMFDKGLLKKYIPPEFTLYFSEIETEKEFIAGMRIAYPDGYEANLADFPKYLELKNHNWITKVISKYDPMNIFCRFL